MNIYLGKLEKEIQHEIKTTGRHATVSEFVRDAVRNQLNSKRLQYLREQLYPAIEQVQKQQFSKKSIDQIFESVVKRKNSK